MVIVDMCVFVRVCCHRTLVQGDMKITLSAHRVTRRNYATSLSATVAAKSGIKVGQPLQ